MERLMALEYVTNDIVPTPRIVLVTKNANGQIVRRNDDEIYQEFSQLVIKHNFFDFAKLASGFYLVMNVVKSMIKRMENEGLIETYLDFDSDEVLLYRVKKQEKKK